MGPDASFTPDQVQAQTFASHFRGLDPNEVKAFQNRVASEIKALRERCEQLESAWHSAEERAARPPVLDEDTLMAAVGEETASILRTARATAAEIRQKATEEAEKIITEASQQAATVREEAKGLLARETYMAEEAGGRIRSAAQSEAAETLEKARIEADQVRAAAEHDRVLTIDGANATRDRILEDLARRRRVATVQIEQLRAGRERLIETYAIVRRTLEEAQSELSRADAEARAAADEVGRRLRSQPEPGYEPSASGEPAASDPASSPAVGGVDVAGAGEVSGGGGTPSGPSMAVPTAPAEGPPPAEGAPPGEGPLPAEVSGSVPVINLPGAEAEVDRNDVAPVITATSTELDPTNLGPSTGLPGRSAEKEEGGRTRRRRGPLGKARSGGPVPTPGASSGSGEADPVDAELDTAGAEFEDDMVDGGAPAVGAGHEVIGPDDPAPAEGDSEEGPLTGLVTSAVDELFAKIRSARPAGRAGPQDGHTPASSEGAPASSEAAPAPASAEAADNSALSDADEALLQKRESALVDLEVTLTRKLKRAMQDEQNDLLDRLRGLKGVPTAARLLSSVDEQLARYADACRPLVEKAAGAGTGFAADLLGRSEPENVTTDVDDLIQETGRSIVDPLRRRLEQAIQMSTDEDQAVLIESLGSAYREWKSQRIERVAGDALSAAFAQGTWRATPEGASMRWIVEDIDGPCPDCDDDGLAGMLPKGEAFPTGQHHPPAHSGCRCLLVPVGD